MDAWCKVGPTSNICLKRQKKRKKADFLGAGTGSEWGRRELKRERRETPPSLYDLRRSGGRNPSSQDLKFIYSTRATRGYRQHAISPKISGLKKKI